MASEFEIVEHSLYRRELIRGALPSFIEEGADLELGDGNQYRVIEIAPRSDGSAWLITLQRIPTTPDSRTA